MSTAAATRREPRGAGPASVVVGTAVVPAAGLVVVGAGRVVDVAAAPLVVAAAVVVGDAPAPSYIATHSEDRDRRPSTRRAQPASPPAALAGEPSQTSPSG